MSTLGQPTAALTRLMEVAADQRYSGTLLLCFGAEPTDRPVTVFQHLRKTGGSSTRRSLLSAPSVATHLRVEGPGSEENLRPDGIGAWSERVCDALGDDARSRLLAVAGHWARSMAAPLAATGRGVTTLTIVRDPVDRVLSRYYFGLRGATEQPRGPRHEPLDEVYRRYGEGRVADSSAHRRRARFFNGLSRELLAHRYPIDELPLCDASSPVADEWRGRIAAEVADYDEVGVLDHLTPFLDRVLASIGSPPIQLVPHEKENTHRPDDGPAPELLELIRRFNWLDQELYAACAARAPRTRLEERARVPAVSDESKPTGQPARTRQPRAERQPRGDREPKAGREHDTRAAKEARRALKKYRVALSDAPAGNPEAQARDQLLYANTLAMIDLAEALRASSDDAR